MKPNIVAHPIERGHVESLRVPVIDGDYKTAIEKVAEICRGQEIGAIVFSCLQDKQAQVESEIAQYKQSNSVVY